MMLHAVSKFSFGIIPLTFAISYAMQVQAAETQTTTIQQTKAQTVTQLPVIEVNAIHTQDSLLTAPASIYKVTMPSLQNNANVNLSEVLQGVAGLQINNRENYAQDLQLSIRGFGARSTFGVRGVRLYVDGIPATMPDGQGQTSNIDLNSLSDVEVLTGPFSSIYGNSSGGVVLANTQEGQGRDSVKLGYMAGSHDKQQSQIVLQGGAKHANEPAYVISSSYFDTDGYRDHSSANKVLSNAKLTWNLEDDSKINWVLNRVSIHADDPQGLTREQVQQNPKQVNDAKNIYNVRKDLEQIQTGVTWTKPLTQNQELYAMAYFGNRQVTQYQSIPESAQKNPRHAGGVIDFDRNYFGADVRWTGKDILPNTTLIAGLALDQMNEDRKGYENFNAAGIFGVKGKVRRNEDNTLWNIDPYLQASWQFIPSMTLDTGLRYSNVHYKSDDHYIVGVNGDDSGKNDYQKLLPSVALNWTILPTLSSYVSYGKGFETPTFTEMAYRTDGQGGFNFSLKPASSDNYEIGLKADSVIGMLTLAGFYTETQNDIVSAGTNYGRATFRNADQTIRKGAELSLNKNIWQDLNAQLSYSLIDAKFDRDIVQVKTNTGSVVPAISKGNNIPGIARNQAYARLAWQPQQGFQAGIDIRYSDKVYVDDANTDYASGYTITGANLGYAWKNKDWTLNTFARIDNIFDKKYIGSVIVNDGNKRYFEPADKLNFSAGLSLSKSF